MNAIDRQVAALELEAARYSKLAMFEFSPVLAKFYRGRAGELMAEAAALRTADLEARAAAS